MTSKQYVVFNLNKEEFGIDIMKVKEIIPYKEAVHIPNSPSFIEGVLNYRGNVIPIINLKKRFNMNSDEITQETRIIVISLKEKEIGFIVDQASQTLRLDENEIDPAPDLIPEIDRRYLNGVGKIDGNRLLILLNLHNVLTDKEILEIDEMDELEIWKWGGLKLGDSNLSIDKINDILQKTIYSIQNSKEEIIEIVEHARKNVTIVERELYEIKEKVGEVIREVDLLEIEERKKRSFLANVDKNFHIYSEEDLEDAYDMANKVRIELLIKREEEKNLIGKRKELEMRLKSAKEVYKKAEKAWKSISVVTEYLKGNLDEILFTVDNLNKRQALGIKVIEAQEEEKHRIARDIHDGPAQSIANILIKAELCERLVDKDKDKFKQELTSLKDIIRLTLKDVRKIIYDLRPMSLDDLGLIPTLERYISNFSDFTGINVELKVFGQEVDLNSSIQIAIFRVVQEGLSNINKHSKATEAKIVVEFTATRLNVTIVDNGIGFDYDKVYHDDNGNSGYGLINMKERIQILGGSLSVKSAPYKGTRINFHILLSEGEN